MTFRRVPMAMGEEQEIAPEGEYLLLIRKVVAKKTKKGDDMDVLTITFPEEPTFQPFSHYVTYSKPSDSEDMQRLKARETRRLCSLFGVPWTEEGFDPEDLIGAEARCRVTVDVYEPEGKEARESNKLVLPRVPDAD